VATGGLRFNVPGGSYFQMQGSYTQGALRYISHTQWPTGSSYDDNAKALIAASTCGNQAGAGNFLPAVFSTVAIANFPTQQSGSITNVTNCDPNWQMGYIGTRTQWNITSQFYMGVDVVLYTKMYTGFAGLGIFRAPGTGPGSERAGGVYSIENQDNWAVTFRVHRDFVL
jgi:hypothetical protein